MDGEAKSKQGYKALNDKGVGTVYAILAYLAWGLLPLYWKLLEQVPAQEILAHRIFWSFVLVSGIMLATGGLASLKTILSSRKNTVLLLFCSVILSLNWFTYIWAVNANQVIEASMGYYINPLLTVLLAMIVLKEKLDFWQGIAVLFASIGVIILTVQYGQVPWIALTLAVTFAIYSLIKRVIKVESVSGLALETALITPVAFAFILFKEFQGTGAMGTGSLSLILLLAGAGVATATPLMWFAKAAQRLELITIGFLQYIAPSISLFLGVIVFKEQFTATHLISFSFIWIALIIYSLSKAGLLKSKSQYQKNLNSPADQKAT